MEIQTLYFSLCGLLCLVMGLVAVSRTTAATPQSGDDPDTQFTKMLQAGSMDVRRTYGRDAEGRTVCTTVLTDPRTGITYKRTKTYGRAAQ